METITLYVKNTSNCAGLSLQTFHTLGPIWEGKSVRMWLGPDRDRKRRDVVGWTDLFGGSPCPVRIVKVQYHGRAGYLVHGGNSGVRILDSRAKPVRGVNDHLPPGWGQAIIWVEEDDADDLPQKVRKVTG